MLDCPIWGGATVVAGLASAAFVFLVQQREGLAARGDDWTFLTPATLVAHGYPSCAYAWSGHYAPIAPVFPMALAALMALTRVGMGAAFRVPPGFRASCHNAYTLAASSWSQHHYETRLLALSMVAWLVALWGVVALVRTTQRARTGWELLAVLVVSVVPPVFMTMTSPAHPEYALALGLGLLGWAQLRRGRAVLAGVCLGLAVLAQGELLLVAVPLVVWSGPAARRVGAAGVATVAAVAASLDLLAHGRLHSVLLGAGATISTGSTWLDELHLHGTVLRAASRGLPVAGALLLALAARRRLSSGPDGAVAPVLAGLAAALGLRLVFEVSVWGYYFSGVALTLCLAMVAGRRWSWPAGAWLVAVSVVFNPRPHLYWVEGIPHVPEWLVQTVLSAWAVAVALALALGPGAAAPAPEGTAQRPSGRWGSIHDSGSMSRSAARGPQEPGA